jgi:hypothetical protein
MSGVEYLLVRLLARVLVSRLGVEPELALAFQLVHLSELQTVLVSQ